MNLISPSQYGFVPQCKIWDNIHSITNIIELKDHKGVLLFLDQEKAYNRVDWYFLSLALTKKKFSTIFIQ